MAYRSPYAIPGGDKIMPHKPTIFVEVGVREVVPGYRSAYALADIALGTILFRDGGVVVSSIEDVLPEKKYAVLIDDGLWLAPRDYDNMDATCFLNHSCESNVARVGGSVYIAKRHIRAGDDLTLDYAPLVSDFESWFLDCECGSAKCRKRITSVDYLKPDIARALWTEWLPYVQRKIRAAGLLR